MTVSLETRLAEIAALEEDASSRGWTVFPLAKDVAHWHRYGIRTGDELDQYLDDCEKDAQFEARLDAYYDDPEWIEWMDRCEAEEIRWRTMCGEFDDAYDAAQEEYLQ